MIGTFTQFVYVKASWSLDQITGLCDELIKTEISSVVAVLDVCLPLSIFPANAFFNYIINI